MLFVALIIFSFKAEQIQILYFQDIKSCEIAKEHVDLAEPRYTQRTVCVERVIK